jgi:hypothetical protein
LGINEAGKDGGRYGRLAFMIYGTFTAKFLLVMLFQMDVMRYCGIAHRIPQRNRHGIASQSTWRVRVKSKSKVDWQVVARVSASRKPIKAKERRDYRDYW